MATVTSNGCPLPVSPRYLVPARDSTALLDRPDLLRARLGEDGFVWLRNVLPADAVRRLRGQYFSLFPAGYLADGTTPEQGLFSGARPASLPAHGVEGHPAHRFVRSRPFLDFAGDPRLLHLAETLLDAPCRQLPRRIMRHFDRAAPAASRAHLDLTYLDRGTERLVTVWVPVGPCPLDTGGLVYLAGSHRLPPQRLDALRGRTDRPRDTRPLSHDLAWVAEQLGSPWSWADYAAGDVTVHLPRTVHASLDTRTDAMRASIDLRYVAEGEPVDPRWLHEWAGDDGD